MTPYMCVRFVLLFDVPTDKDAPLCAVRFKMHHADAGSHHLQVLFWDVRKLAEPVETLLIEPMQDGKLLGGVALEYESTMPTKFQVIARLSASAERLLHTALLPRAIWHTLKHATLRALRIILRTREAVRYVGQIYTIPHPLVSQSYPCTLGTPPVPPPPTIALDDLLTTALLGFF